jgi:hypothetical protein
MLKIFRRSEPDTAPVKVGRVPPGGVVTRVPDFDSITPIGLDRSAPDKEAFRQRVRQLVAEQAACGTLSGAAAQLLDLVVEDWQQQWDIAAHEAYLADLTGVEALIASQAGEHADRVTAQVAALQRRRAAELQAHSDAYRELTGQDHPAEEPPADVVVLPQVLSRHARHGSDARSTPPNLVAIEGGGA